MRTERVVVRGGFAAFSVEISKSVTHLSGNLIKFRSFPERQSLLQREDEEEDQTLSEETVLSVNIFG